MNLNQLKLFYMAVKRGSLSAAAEALNITQPAVTKGIKRIEEHYEVGLIRGFGKKPELTEAGVALYGFAEKIFELERLAEDCLHDYQQEKRRHLHIHSSESFGAYYLPAIIKRFNETNPHVRVTVDILPNQQVVENTLDLQNDVGFISNRVKNKKLVIREILDDELVIILPIDHPFQSKDSLTPKELEGQTMIMHERGSVLHEVIHRFMQENGISFSMPITLSNNEAIKRAVEAGMGIAMISRGVVNKEIQANKLAAIPLADQSIGRKFYIIYHRDKFISGPLQRLVDMIQDWASELEGGMVP